MTEQDSWPRKDLHGGHECFVELVFFLVYFLKIGVLEYTALYELDTCDFNVNRIM